MAKPRYGKIYETTWRDAQFKRLSDKSKLVYFFLLSCNEGNCIGLFRIGMGSIDDHLGFGEKVIRESLDELRKAEMVEYEDGFVFIPKFLKWNSFESPNAATNGADTLNDLLEYDAPPTRFVADLWERSKSYLGKFYDHFKYRVDEDLIKPYITAPQTEGKPLASPTEGLGKPLARDTEEVRSEKLEVRSEKLKEKESKEKDFDLFDNPSEEVGYADVQALYNKVCKSLPKCTSLSDKRRKAIDACVKEFGFDRIGEAFALAEQSDFLSGRNGGWNGCGFDWLLVKGNMLKVLEGYYKNRKGQKPSTGSKTNFQTMRDSDFDGVESGSDISI